MTDPYANQPAATLPWAVYLCAGLGMYASSIILFWALLSSMNHTTGPLISYRCLPIIYLYVRLFVSHGQANVEDLYLYNKPNAGGASGKAHDERGYHSGGSVGTTNPPLAQQSVTIDGSAEHGKITDTWTTGILLHTGSD